MNTHAYICINHTDKINALCEFDITLLRLKLHKYSNLDEKAEFVMRCVLRELGKNEES